MNRSLRKRHRAMFITLAVIVPLLFLAGLGVRQSIPAVQDPTVPPAARGRGDLEVLREDAAPGELPIRVAWLRAPGAGTQRMVGLELDGPVKQPDLLVYWDEHQGGGSDPSEEARLLGRVGDRLQIVWNVPQPSSSGRLVFYSAAWKESAGSMTPPPEWSALP
jgi:hypothetical protein